MAARGNGSTNVQGQHPSPGMNGGLNHGTDGRSVMNHGINGDMYGVHPRNVATGQGAAQGTGQTAGHGGWGANEQHHLVELTEQAVKLVEAKWQQQLQIVRR